MPQFEALVGPVPVLHWLLNLSPEFPFVDREIKPVPRHILRMLDRARDGRPNDLRSHNDKTARATRDGHSSFIDPFLRRQTNQSYTLDRGQDLDVCIQVDRLRFLLDVDNEGDGNMWEQKWAGFGKVHNHTSGQESDEDEEEDEEEKEEEHHPGCKVARSESRDSHDSDATLADSDSLKTPRKLGLRAFINRHRKSDASEHEKPHTSDFTRPGVSTHNSSESLDRYGRVEKGREGSSTPCEACTPTSPGSPQDKPENEGFSTTFMHRFQNELLLLIETPFAPSVFQATGTMFKLRAKGLVKQYLPSLPFRGSHFEQTKQSARAILLMDRCVDAKNRCLKINEFWKNYGLSFKDQVNFIYTTCFYEIIREVAINANRIVSQLFEGDETKVRRRYKRQRAHRLWEIGDWMVQRGTQLAAERGIKVEHNPAINTDDVISSVVSLVAYQEFVIINHRPYQAQTKINYGFTKEIDGDQLRRKSIQGDFYDHATCEHGGKSRGSKIIGYYTAASLWTPWSVASCNPLTLSDPKRAEDLSGFDFRYEDVFKSKSQLCDCGGEMFPQ